MGIFGKLSFQKDTKTAEKKKITDLTDLERAEIEDQTRIGRSARDVAATLGLHVETIYNYRKMLTEQDKKIGSDTADILKSKMQEREILKADYELQKLKLDLEQKQQELEMQKLEFKRDMSEWKKELGSDGDDEVKVTDLISLFMASRTAQPKQNNNPTPQPNKTELQSPNDNVEPAAVEDLKDLSDEEIRAIIKPLVEENKKMIKVVKAMPDNLLFDQIADRFPTLTDKTIERAIEIFRSEY